MKDDVAKLKNVLGELEEIKKGFFRAKNNKHGMMIGRAIRMIENVKRAEANQLQNEERLAKVQKHYSNLEKMFNEAIENQDVSRAQGILARLPNEHRSKLAPKLVDLMGSK